MLKWSRSGRSDDPCPNVLNSGLRDDMVGIICVVPPEGSAGLIMGNVLGVLRTISSYSFIVLFSSRSSSRSAFSSLVTKQEWTLTIISTK